MNLNATHGFGIGGKLDSGRRYYFNNAANDSSYDKKLFYLTFLLDTVL